MHNNNIKPPTPKPKIVIFSKEPTGIYDIGATSGVGALEDANYFISTVKNSNKCFVIPNIDTMSENEIMKLAHELRDPENKVDIVPGVHSTMISGVKFADADYVTILDKEGINIYDGKTTKITISEKAVLSGYHIEEGLWLIWRWELNQKCIGVDILDIFLQRNAP